MKYDGKSKTFRLMYCCCRGKPTTHRCSQVNYIFEQGEKLVPSNFSKTNWLQPMFSYFFDPFFQHFYCRLILKGGRPWPIGPNLVGITRCAFTRPIATALSTGSCLCGKTEMWHLMQLCASFATEFWLVHFRLHCWHWNSP